jgi:hypothetical protein
LRKEDFSSLPRSDLEDLRPEEPFDLEDEPDEREEAPEDREDGRLREGRREGPKERRLPDEALERRRGSGSAERSEPADGLAVALGVPRKVAVRRSLDARSGRRGEDPKSRDLVLAFERRVEPLERVLEASRRASRVAAVELGRVGLQLGTVND